MEDLGITFKQVAPLHDVGSTFGNVGTFCMGTFGRHRAGVIPPRIRIRLVYEHNGMDAAVLLTMRLRLRYCSC